MKAKGINAVVAGGLPRDIVLGKNWRDIDLYVHMCAWSEAQQLLFGNVTWPEYQHPSSDRYVHASIGYQEERRAKPEFVGGALVNLVGLNGYTPMNFDIEFVISRFNLGICKIGFDLNRFLIHPDFNRDREDQRVTLFRTDWGHEATMKQWLRLQKKIPWPLRVAATQGQTS